MSRKYISQRISQNFVYPNNEVSEYDLDIVHDLNNNSVSGTVNSFSATTFNSTGITISYNCTWNKNNADPYINGAGQLNLFSVHMMASGQNYYKPFRMVTFVSDANTSLTTSIKSGTFTVTPAMMGLASFSGGTYNFEVRFIGKRAVYPVCVTLSINAPTPTPTPTPTATSTPTPTPTSTPTPTPTPTTTVAGCKCYSVTYTTIPGDLSVRYRNCATDTTTTTLINTLETIDNGDGTFSAFICVKQGGAYAIPVCVQGGIEVTCDPYIWTEGGNCTIASDCYSPVPTPTPTSTPTPTATATPTPTPTSTPVPVPCVCVEIIVTGSTAPEESYAGSIEYNNCSSQLVGELFTTPGIRYRCMDYTGGLIQVFNSTNITYSIKSGASCSGGTCPTGTTITCVCYSYVNTTEGSLTIDYVACDGDQPIIGVPGGSSGTFCARIGQYTGDTGINITMCSPTIYCQDTETVCTSCGGGPTPTPTSTPTPTPTATPTPTPTPTETPLDCLCYCYTYTTVPSDLSVRYRNCSTDTTVTTLINSLETMDNGDGTFTACICVKQGGAYAIPVCVQGGLEVTCPDTWVSGSTCDGLAGPCFLG